MIVCAVSLDLLFATLMALGSVVVAFVLFIGWRDPSVARLSLAASFFVTTTILILAGQILRMTVRDLNAKANEYEAFNRELQHRARNTMQLILIMASAGLKTSGPQNFLKDFAGRLAALSRANEFLGLSTHQTSAMLGLVKLATAPFDQSAITVCGPAAEVTSKVGMRLMMAIHELGTNATKYGALSCAGGKVTINWTVQGHTARLRWCESSGPLVEKPSRKGLGSRLLAPHPPMSRVEIDFAESGVICEIEFPVL